MKHLPGAWDCWWMFNAMNRTVLFQKNSQHHNFPLHGLESLGFGILYNKSGQCVLCDTAPSRLTGLPGGKQVTSHTAFPKEASRKQRQRCRCLADGRFINVSSMNWSGALSVGHWDKTDQVTQKPKHWWLLVGGLVTPEWCRGVLWSKQEQLDYKYGNTNARVIILCRGVGVSHQ